MSDLDTLSKALDEIGCKFVQETDFDNDENIEMWLDYIYPCNKEGTPLGIFTFHDGKFKEWEV